MDAEKSIRKQLQSSRNHGTLTQHVRCLYALPLQCLWRDSVTLISTLLTFVMCRIRPHSIILSRCKPGCKAGFRPGLQPGFRQLRVGLRHAFDQFSIFLSKTLPRTAAGSLVRARARQMKFRKKTVLSKFAAGFRDAFDLLATRLSIRFESG